jgi:hypothetical protein
MFPTTGEHNGPWPFHMNSVVEIQVLFCLLQGAGTAIGELPPYFMARAARLSGRDVDDEDYDEIEELMKEKQEHPGDLVRTRKFCN